MTDEEMEMARWEDDGGYVQTDSDTPELLRRLKRSYEHMRVGLPYNHRLAEFLGEGPDSYRSGPE